MGKNAGKFSENPRKSTKKNVKRATCALFFPRQRCARVQTGHHSGCKAHLIMGNTKSIGIERKNVWAKVGLQGSGGISSCFEASTTKTIQEEMLHKLNVQGCHPQASDLFKCYQYFFAFYPPASSPFAILWYGYAKKILAYVSR